MSVIFVLVWLIIGLLIYSFLDGYLKKIGEENEGWDDIAQGIHFGVFLGWAKANFFQDVQNKFLSYLLAGCLTLLALAGLELLNRIINKYFSKNMTKEKTE